MSSKFGLGRGRAGVGAVFRLAVTLLVGAVAHAEPPDLFTQISVRGQPTCTGATVLMAGRRYLITAAHCLTGLRDDDSLEVSEGASIVRDQVRSRAGVTELRVGDAIVLQDFDVSLWELKIWQLARTRTLTPRLTEPAPGEEVQALGYPGGHDATTLACRNISGNLVTVDGASFQPAQSMTCATDIPALGGMSGGPAIDANGRYLGVVDYQSPSGDRGLARVGFVPYRVFKPYRTAGDEGLVWGGLRHGYTFKDYFASGDGATEVTVRYAERAEGHVIRADVKLITVRAPEYSARATLTAVPHESPRLDVTLTDADGRVRTVKAAELYAPSYLMVRSVIKRLRE